MIYVLENDLVKVSISSLGAEVQSCILKEDQSEYIWQGNPEIWAGHAPLVFPVVGRLKEDEYTFEGNIYRMQQHGFGCVSEFVVTEQKDDEIVFTLVYDNQTLESYPFKFELQVCYSLQGTTLTKMHTMINLDDKTLYYGIGGHDSYNLCLENGEAMEDYYLDFGDLDKLHPLEVDENFYILKDTYEVPLMDGKLSLDMEVFKKGALVCHAFPVRNISIKSRKSNRAIHLSFEDFNTIGIWTRYMPYPTNYLCLEPWSTLPDCGYLGKEIEEKVDIRKVLPKAKDKLSFSVTIQKYR